MPIPFEALLHFSQTIAAIALLAIAFGSIHRWLVRPGLADIVLGVLFGLSAVLAMSDPLMIQPGVIVDLRSVPVALAAVYLRPAGALTALGIAVAMRLSIGGMGATSGVVGLMMTYGASLAVRLMTARTGMRSLFRLLILAAASSTGIGSFFLLPWDLASGIIMHVAPSLFVCNTIGFVVVAKIIEREQRLLSRETTLLQASITDPLTRLLNRRGFEDAYAKTLTDRRIGAGSALLLLDMDHFKSLNDTHGHDFGDRVLREVADRLGTAMRRRDLIGRIGGEEMVVHMSGISRDDAAEAAARLCHEIGRHPIERVDGRSVHVSASIGVHWSAAPTDLLQALSSADRALYAAKHEGRDRYVMAA